MNYTHFAFVDSTTFLECLLNSWCMLTNFFTMHLQMIIANQTEDPNKVHVLEKFPTRAENIPITSMHESCSWPAWTWARWSSLTGSTNDLDSPNAAPAPSTCCSKTANQIKSIFEIKAKYFRKKFHYSSKRTRETSDKRCYSLSRWFITVIRTVVCRQPECFLPHKTILLSELDESSWTTSSLSSASRN